MGESGDSYMNLEEMGQILRQERERQGVSLEKAAAEIKISKKYLTALEEGRRDELPHPVYAKGFLKNYTRLLGLDPGEFTEVLDQFHAVEEDHLLDGPRYEVKESSPSIRQGSAPSGFKPSLWFVVPLAVIFIGLIWYFFFGGGVSSHLTDLSSLFTSKTSTQAQEQPAPPKPLVSAKPEPAPAKPEPVPVKPEPAPAEPAQYDAQPVQRDLLATGPGSKAAQEQGAPAAEQENSAVQMAKESQFAASGNQVVEITASQVCKLDVTDETGQSRLFTLLKGQRLALRFNDKVEVRFVSAPAVAVKLNGKDYPLEAGKTEGRTIQFP